jgi:hypothetical protein
MQRLASILRDSIPMHFRDSLKGTLVRGVDRVLGEVVLRKMEVNLQPPLPVTVHLFLSRKTWRMGMLAMRSFEFWTERRWRWMMHDDGTLNSDESKQTLELFPCATWIARADADRLMASALAQYPVSMQSRMRHLLMPKFFDIHQFAPHRKYIVLDSDVLFFAKPSEILDWVKSDDESCWFNKDHGEAYALPSVEMEAQLGFKIWSPVNSGISLISKNAISLERTERFLQTFEPNCPEPFFLEQTLFAINASAHGAGGFLPPAYEVTARGFRRRGGISRHYAGVLKNDLFYLEGVTALAARLFLHEE